MRKLYLFLFLVVSFMMVFAGDTIKVLRIHHNGNYTDIQLSKIECITHSEYDMNDIPQPNIVTSVVWTSDNQYKFPIEEIESAEVIEKELEGDELYEVVTNDLYNFLSTHESVTLEEIQAQLEQYDMLTMEVRDDILYIQIDNADEIICDPYCRTCVSNSEEEINEVNIEEILEEINKALYPETYNTRRGTDFERPYIPNGLTRAGSDRSVLSKGKILLWDPWKLMKEKISLSGLKVISSIDKDANLSKIKEFSNYDIVFMCCHGTPEGDIIVPASENSDVIFEYDGKVYKGRTIKKEELNSLLPSDLSKTILWTSICWGYKSHLKGLAWDRNVVAFAGCDNQGVNTVPEILFQSFLVYFYSGATVLDATASSFPVEIHPKQNSKDFIYSNTINDNKVSTYYHGFSDVANKKKNISGNYILHCKNTEITGKVINEAKSPINNRPCASLTVPYEWYKSSSAARGHVITRASYDSGVSYGFWIKNKETGKITEKEFDQSKDSICHRYDYDNIISRLELLGNTDDLEAGTYEYRTYLEIDGKRTYSEEMYEFMKQYSFCPDDNHPHKINLALPSGRLWSCCNVGASSPKMPGGYYAWGETEEKNIYDWDNYKFYDNDGSYYATCPPYVMLGDDIQGTSNDVALAVMGDSWRMPTSDEMKELIRYCKFAYVETSNTNCYVAIGSNGNCLLFPVTGYKSGKELLDTGYCYFWSSTKGDLTRGPFYMTLYGDVLGGCRNSEYISPTYGFPIRPVSK